MNDQRFNAGCYSVAEIIKRSEQRKLQKEVSGLALLICGLFICFALTRCMVKIDHPFYSPSSVDVNKTESKGGNNYKEK